MTNDQLKEYVSAAKAAGQSDETIRQNLASHGWQEPAISRALNPSSSAETANHTFFGIRRSRINSPYSLLLAIVLTVSLFILGNKAISDVEKYFENEVSTKLIVDALIVLPFLLIAFALHFSIGERSAKYLILSRPYYMVAAWLLIRLMIEVSIYILDKDSAYGVYIVLIMVVAVLTGMVVFAQKYLKK
jgi:hypothetical protein